MQQETKDKIVKGAAKVVLFGTTILIAVHDINFGLLFACCAGVMDHALDAGFQDSEGKTVEQAILSFMTNQHGRDIEFKDLVDVFEGQYDRDELIEGVYQLKHCKVVTVNA